MDLSTRRIVGMGLRRIPIRRAIKCLKQAEANGLDVYADQIEVLLQAGGHPERVIEAMILALMEQVPYSWDALCQIDLAGKDPVEYIRSGNSLQRFVFDQYSPNYQDKIIGYTKDGKGVGAICNLQYRHPVGIRNEASFEFLQERLAVKIALIINTRESLYALNQNIVTYEDKLLRVAKKIMPTVEQVHLDFYEAMNN